MRVLNPINIRFTRESFLFREAHYEHVDGFLYTPSPFVENVESAPTANHRIFTRLRLGIELPSTVTVGMSSGSQMLRITRKANGEVVFRISGQLTAENVAEMEALLAAEGKGKRIVLECTDLRSVDGEAVKYLEKWETDSIKLKNCGSYIREWIRRERLERESDQNSDK